MSLYEIAKQRATVREFSKDKIDINDVIYAVNVAKEAPSGANKQPWRFLIVTDRKIKEEIRKLCEGAERRFHEKAPEWMKKWFRERGITWEKPFLTDAPVLLLVFTDKGAPYSIPSVWIAIGYLLLALEEKGLCTVTYTPSDTKWVYELLDVPRNYLLQTILPIGKAKGPIKKQDRMPISEILFMERFGQQLK
ncbi:MAG: nitroreductase family protein [Candidatus Asgardarchaeia archaeon]